MFRSIAQEVSARAPRAWSDGAWTTGALVLVMYPDPMPLSRSDHHEEDFDVSEEYDQDCLRAH